ncbi:unnamed protein product [Mycena citricolor]|uniref:RNase H type-1 domain-containing protein n=1 Tax=Mycena citricolor TaxID=2018698 RepID=A0AAD2HR00_9AGAR|nr:unnamed protein product [Mycena citricolor]
MNKSLTAQDTFLSSLHPAKFDFALIQEPLPHPTRNRRQGHKNFNTRKHKDSDIILEAYTLNSLDLTGIEITRGDEVIRVINVYNACDHNETLVVLRQYLANATRHTPNNDPIHYVWAGNFNRHHPLWDEDRNQHLFTNRNLRLADPLLQMLARHSMVMVLPKNIPTLKAHSTGNYTRVDNVFCSADLAKSFTLCNTAPTLRPPCTDHMPILSELIINVGTCAQTPRRVWRAADWKGFRNTLATHLEAHPPKPLRSPGDIEAEIETIDTAINIAVDKHVPLAKPCPHTKRWWNPKLTDERRVTQKMQRISYAHRHIPEHPAHEMARTLRNRLSRSIRDAKERHWNKWLQGLSKKDVWTAQKLVTGPATDGGRARIPNLQIAGGGNAARSAVTNEDKALMFHSEFFLPKPIQSLVPFGATYPEPAYKWKPLSDAVIYAAVARLQPYKARQPGSVPNCVYIHNAGQLVPRLGRVFRAGDKLSYYPQGWNTIHTVVLRKPGKSDYRNPNSYRPIVLSKDHMSLENAARNLQVTAEAELAGILPKTQFGARPGRSTTDAIHSVVKISKDAWRKGKVASLLCMDVKGAFPSVDLDMLTHELRMAGIPKEHTEWLKRRYNGRTSTIAFDDYISPPVSVANGLDQGDPHSGFLWMVYNSGLAGIPKEKHDVLDAHAGLLPIHLLAQKVRQRAALRLATVGNSHPLNKAARNAAARYVKRHRTPLHELMHEFDLDPAGMETIEPMRQRAEWKPVATIAPRSTKEAAIEQEKGDMAEWKVFTDGSGIHGHIGAAAVLYRGGRLIKTARKHLGTDAHHTVYEGEGVGLNLAVGLLIQQRNVQGNVSIYVDNTAAIDATANRDPNPSHYIWDALDLRLRELRRTHPNAKVTFCWLPGHVDIQGNEEADKQAKMAAEQLLTNRAEADKLLHKSLRGTLPRSKSAAAQHYNALLQARANDGWKASPRYNKLKSLLRKTPTESFQKLIRKIPRQQATILFQLRAGHVPLARYLHRIGKTDSPTCPYCHRADETVAHYLLACPAHEEERRRMNEMGGRSTLSVARLLTDPKTIPHLMRYLAETRRFAKTHGTLELGDEDTTDQGT